MADSSVSLTKQIALVPKLIYQQAGVDKKLVGNTYEPIQGTAVDALMAELGVHYKPAIFVDIWSSVLVPLKNKCGGGIYDFPGRLDTAAVFRFGITVYYK